MRNERPMSHIQSADELVDAMDAATHTARSDVFTRDEYSMLADAMRERLTALTRHYARAAHSKVVTSDEMEYRHKLVCEAIALREKITRRIRY